MGAVRRLAHAFLAAGDDDLAVAAADRLIAQRHGAQPGAAQLIDPVGGDLEGDAGRDRGLPRRVLALASGEDLAEDDFGDLGRLDPRTPHRLDDRDLAELVRRQARKPAIEGSDWGAGGAGNHDVAHRRVLLRRFRSQCGPFEPNVKAAAADCPGE